MNEEKSPFKGDLEGPDVFKTITDNIGEGYYTEKRSKFFAYAHHVRTADEVKALHQMYKKKYYDARHVCYAYRLGADGAEFRANDDGEPSSTAGKPILGVMLSNDVSDIAIFVIRYYGGVNLGTGGLIVAYREAAQDAMAHSEIVEQLVEEQLTYTFSYPMMEEQLTYTFSYPMMNSVMRVVKDLQPRIVSQNFDNTCSITLAIRKSEIERLRSALEKLNFE